MKETKARLRNNKGITLIALVITIIVLLILAGISITMLSGDSSLFKNAEDAKSKTSQSQVEEAIKLAYMSALAREKSTKTETFNATMKEELGKYGYNNAEVNANNEIVKIDSKNYDFNGNIIKDAEPGEKVKVTIKDNYTDSNGDTATIPAGFKVSTVEGEQIIDNGLVVIAEDGSEFVWIPVPIVISDTEADATTNKAMAINIGTEANPQYRGILYNFSGVESTVQENCTTTTDSNREPAYLTDPTNGDESDYNKDSNGEKIVTEESLQDEYNKMIESVKEYGGFYVGRYETSLDNNKAKSIKEVTPTSATNTNSNMWYGLYKVQKAYSTDSVQGSMIWGSQYDAMLNFALTSSDASKVTENTHGNHSGSILKTKATATDKIVNIYDLEGNMLEWTLRASNNKYRTRRGGDCSQDYNFAPNATSQCTPITKTITGSRLALYIRLDSDSETQ